MKIEMKSAIGGKTMHVPGMGLEKNELPEWAEMKAFERRLRWLRFWNWVGWKIVAAIATVLLLTGLFIWSGPLLRLADPTAASLDAGIMGVIMLAILVVVAFAVSAWLLVRLVRPTLTEFYEWDIEQDDLKKGISSCLEAKILTGIFSGLLLLFCVVFWVLL